MFSSISITFFQDLSEDTVDGRPVSPCNVVFVGDNVVPAKSSLSSKPKTKKVKYRNYISYYLLVCHAYPSLY
jgi:hypothetical protein